MRRTVLIALACLALASAHAWGQDDDYTCYKVKDLKQPQFAGSTASSVSDELAIDSDAAVKKWFLYCAPTEYRSRALMNGTTDLTCYKIKPSDPGADGKESGLRKTYVLCMPASES